MADNPQQSNQQQPDIARTLAQNIIARRGNQQGSQSGLGDVGRGLVVGGARTLSEAVPGLLDIGFGGTHSAVSALGRLAGADPTSRFQQGADFLFNRPTSRLTSAIGEATGFQPGAFADRLAQTYSPETLAANRAVEQAAEEAKSEGLVGQFLAGAGATLANPRSLIPLASENVAPLVAGGAAARGLSAVSKLGGVARGAIGEGSVAAGMQMSGIDESVDPGKAAAAAVASGAAVGAITYGAGRLANRLGFGDPEAVIAGGARLGGDAAEQATRRNLVSRIAGGAVSEGILEELPQSSVETMLANWAEDKPLLDNVGHAAAQGMLVGAMYGGAFGPFDGRGRKQTDPADLTGEDAPRSGSQFNINNLDRKQLIDSYRRIDKIAREAAAYPDVRERANKRLGEIRRTMERKGIPPEVVDQASAEDRAYETYIKLEAIQADLEVTSNPDDREVLESRKDKLLTDMVELSREYPDIRKTAVNRHVSDLLGQREKLLNQKTESKRQKEALKENTAALERLEAENDFVDFGAEETTTDEAPPPPVTEPAAPATASLEPAELPTAVPSPAQAAEPVAEAPDPVTEERLPVEEPVAEAEPVAEEEPETTVDNPPEVQQLEELPPLEEPPVETKSKALAAFDKRTQKTKPPKKKRTRQTPRGEVVVETAPTVELDPAVQTVLDTLPEEDIDALLTKDRTKFRGGKQRRTPNKMLDTYRNASVEKFLKDGVKAEADGGERKLVYDIVAKERAKEIADHQFIQTEDGDIQLVPRFDPITDENERMAIMNAVLMPDKDPASRPKWASYTLEYLKQALVLNKENPLQATAVAVALDNRIAGDNIVRTHQAVMESILVGKRRLMEEVARRRNLETTEDAKALVGPWFAGLGVTRDSATLLDKAIAEAVGEGRDDDARMLKAQKQLVKDLKLYEHATAAETNSWAGSRAPSGIASMEGGLARASLFNLATVDKVSGFLTGMKGAKNLTLSEMSRELGRPIDKDEFRRLQELDQARNEAEQDLYEAQQTFEVFSRNQRDLPEAVAELEEEGMLDVLRDEWDAAGIVASIEADAEVPVVPFELLTQNGRELRLWIKNVIEDLDDAITYEMDLRAELVTTEGNELELLSEEEARDRVVRRSYEGIVGRLKTPEEMDEFLSEAEFRVGAANLKYEAAQSAYDSFRDALTYEPPKEKITFQGTGSAPTSQAETRAAQAEKQAADLTRLGDTPQGAVLQELKAQMNAPDPTATKLDEMRANQQYMKWVKNENPQAAGPTGGNAYSLVAEDENVYTINKWGSEWRVFKTADAGGVPSSLTDDAGNSSEWVATVKRQNPAKQPKGDSAVEAITAAVNAVESEQVREPIRMTFDLFTVGDPNTIGGDPQVNKILQNPDFYAQNEDTSVEVTEMPVWKFLQKAMAQRGYTDGNLKKDDVGVMALALRDMPEFRERVDGIVARFERGDRVAAPTINYRANDIDGMARALAAADPRVGQQMLPVVEVYRQGAKQLKTLKPEDVARAAVTTAVEAPTPSTREIKPEKKKRPKLGLAKTREQRMSNRRDTELAVRGGFVRNFVNNLSFGNIRDVNADEFITGIAEDPTSYKDATNNEVYIVRVSPQDFLSMADGTTDQTVDTDQLNIDNVPKLAEQLQRGKTRFAIPYLNFDADQSSGRLLAVAAQEAGIDTINAVAIVSKNDPMFFMMENNPNFEVVEREPFNRGAVEAAAPRTTSMMNGWVKNPTSIGALTDAIRRHLPPAVGRKVTVAKTMGDPVIVKTLRDAGVKGMSADSPAFFFRGRVYLVADNIQSGEELSTLMHEVGVHAGMDPKLVTDLSATIQEWVNTGTDLESSLAREAMNNIAGSLGIFEENGIEITQQDVDQEVVAYFVEAAIQRGINPTQMNTVPSAGLRGFFQKIIRWISTAWRKATGNPAPDLYPQDIVDMAYGAAQTAFREPISADEVAGDLYFKNRASSRVAKDFEQRLDPNTRAAVRTFKKYNRKFLNIASFTHDFVDRANKYFQPDEQGRSVVREVFDSIFRRISERGKLESLIQMTLDETNNWSEQKREAVNKFLYESTVREAWGFNPQWEGAVEAENLDDGLVEMYNKLAPDEQKVVYNTLRLADNLFNQEQEALRAEIVRSYEQQIARTTSDMETRATLRNEMAEDLAEFDNRYRVRKPAWLPLRRFGEFAVVFKSQELQDALNDGDNKLVREMKKSEQHYWVGFYESNTKAEKALEEAQQKYATSGGAVEKFDRMTMETKPELIPFNFMNTWRQNLESAEALDESGRVKNVTASGLAKALNKMYITQLAETSVRKSELERLVVAGPDQDMMRNFVQHGRGMAAMIAAINLNGDVNANLQNLKDQAKAGDELATRETKTEIMNEILERVNAQMDYEPRPWESKLMGFTSAWMLIMSPAYYLQNVTQPWMLTMPVLASDHGVAKAARFLTSAYKDAKNIWNVGLTGELADADRHQAPTGASQKVVAEYAAERGLLKELQSLGLLDVGMATDLGSLAGSSLVGMPWVNRQHQKFLHAVRTVELFNRTSTALASYRLARSKGMSIDKAHEYSKQQVRVTQGDYSGVNAPRLINKLPVGKLVTQFRKFQLIQISLLTRSINDIFKAEGPAEKLVAAKQLMYLFGTHAAVGGMMGLPAANLLGPVLASLLGDEDEPKDIELLVRRKIGNKEVADLILKGFPAWMGIDTSARLGMGQTFSVLPFTDMEFTREGWGQAAAALMLGPLGGVGAQMFDGIGLMNNNNVALGMAMMMPRGPRDLMQALIYSQEGVRRRNATQDLAISADELSSLDLFWKGVGWPTKTLTDRQNVNRWLTQTEEHFNDRANEIKYNFIHGDARQKLDARWEWRNLQAMRAEYGFKPQSIKVLTNTKRDQIKRERNTIGGVPVRDSNRQFVADIFE